MTVVYLAAIESSTGFQAMLDWPWESEPVSVLTSFAYRALWAKCRDAIRPAAVMLDSGAFTAYNNGKKIDIDALIAEFQTGGYAEGVGLDVIGDWKGSKDNLDYMRERGAIGMMPVFHIGDPWHLLEYYCRHWPKVGLSCRFGESRAESLKFYEQCFARCWPHKFHSFGGVDVDMLMRFPFHSADASTWLAASTQFHNVLVKRRGRPKQAHLDGPITSTTARRAACAHVRYMRGVEATLAKRWASQLAKIKE